MAVMDRFSVFAFALGDPPPAASELISAARHADALAFHSISLPHHLTLPAAQVYTGFPRRDILDPLALLPAMAAVTENIKVGTNSAIVPVLAPYVWARYFATLDVMSGGRALAGMAMGWFEKDFAAAKADIKRRARHFDEALGLIRRLWTESSVSHSGETCELMEMELEPKPMQKPHPPIWIGGHTASIERTSMHAQYLLPANLTVEEVRNVYLPRLDEANAKFGTNAGICLSVRVNVGDSRGPDPDMLPRIARLVNSRRRPVEDIHEISIAGSPGHCAERIEEYVDAGISHFLLDFQYHGLTSVEYSIGQMERFVSEVVPLLDRKILA